MANAGDISHALIALLPLGRLQHPPRHLVASWQSCLTPSWASSA